MGLEPTQALRPSTCFRDRPLPIRSLLRENRAERMGLEPTRAGIAHPHPCSRRAPWPLGDLSTAEREGIEPPRAL